MSAFPLTLVRLSKLRIPLLNHLIDGNSCKIYSIFIFFLFLQVFMLSYTLIIYPHPSN